VGNLLTMLAEQPGIGRRMVEHGAASQGRAKIIRSGDVQHGSVSAWISEQQQANGNRKHEGSGADGADMVTVK